MPVTAEWDNPEKTRILMRYIGAWTWDEIYQTTDEIKGLMETVDYKVDIIQDWSQSTSIPSNGLSHAKNLIDKRHPRTGTIVLVGVSSVFLALWNVLGKLYGFIIRKYPFFFAHSVEEAREILSTQRSAQG